MSFSFATIRKRPCAKYFFVVCAIFFIVIDITEQGAIRQPDAPKGLYDASDHIVILNATNIKSTIYGTTNAWIVEFYSSWCGHCIHFAPVFKQLAAEVESWQSVIKVGAIDCSDESNVPACREYEIMGYPTVHSFPPMCKEKTITEDGKEELTRGDYFEKSDKVSDLKNEIMELVAPHFPHILGKVSETVSSFSDLWSSVKSSTTSGIPEPSLLIIMYEGEKTVIGKELALRLSSYPQIRVVRFQKRNALYDKLGLKGEWPAAAYVKADLETGSLTIPRNQDIVTYLESTSLKMMKIEPPPPPDLKPAAQLAAQLLQAEEDAKQEQSNLEEPNAKASEDVVSIEDLIHAVRNSLRNEVGLQKVLSGSKLKAVQDYVHVLGQLLPADRRELIVFLMKLDKWLQTQNDEIQINDYLDKLTELELENHPWDIDVNTWANCRGTIAGRRGYPCGLWRLFHTLSMLASQKTQEIFVLPVMHGYIKEFFGCTECVKHFTQMIAEDGALMISTVREQALWLWKAHNKVNERTKGTASEDPGYPKGKYPNDKQCSSCYKEDGIFDEDKVFEYLLNVYSSPIRTLRTHQTEKSKRDAEPVHSGPKHAPRLSSGIFSGTDYWIFCIVYLSVAALLIFGYLHFKSGSRRRVDPLAICRKFIQTSKSMV
ncbi:Sulfhydryl oxidase 2 [Orchesella cincta]|uniref:Sulfhydryl oxidase n=1 Tax=Orchesella cincta TaxID=48709 RepID=A0A1D2N1L3_ORCCI|nr:Sulfhydryl oxidase 2 [Orchesella cincta]